MCRKEFGSPLCPHAVAPILKAMTQDPTLAQKQGLETLLLLLSDAASTRFDLLMASDREPLEAAQEVIEDLGRYDPLAGLASETEYQKLKTQVESSVSNKADALIREQNPR